jgi:hypothetical protein
MIITSERRAYMNILDNERVEYEGAVYTKPILQKAFELLLDKYPKGHKWESVDEFIGELFCIAKKLK